MHDVSNIYHVPLLLLRQSELSAALISLRVRVRIRVLENSSWSFSSNVEGCGEVKKESSDCFKTSILFLYGCVYMYLADFPALLAERLRMGPRHAPGEAAEALPVKLDKACLEGWEDLARRHDEGRDYPAATIQRSLDPCQVEPRLTVTLTLFVAVSEEVVIGLVGKYTELHDTYLSVVKALLHASLHCNRRLIVKWIDSAKLDKNKMTLVGSGMSCFQLVAMFQPMLCKMLLCYLTSPKVTI